MSLAVLQTDLCALRRLRLLTLLVICYDVRVHVAASNYVMSHAENAGIKVSIFLINFTNKLIKK
jgi:hypothetical protein